MSDPKIVLSAVDATKAAFDSAQANLKGLHTSVIGVQGALSGFAVAIGAAALASRVMGALEAADQINKLSQRTGIATEQLSQLQFAAKLSDVSTESLTNGIKKLNVSIAEGLGGDKAKVEMFRNLGISLKDASGNAKTADKVMLEMANTFSTAKDGAVKTAYAVGLMGKAGDEMIPLLNGGGQAIADMMQKANRLGLTIGTDFAKQAEEFNDNLTIVKSSSDRLAISLAGDLVSGLGKTVKAMAEASLEGGKLAAVIAGIETLFTGDDQHKNNVALVDDTEKLMALQNGLLKLQANGYTADTLAVKSQQKQIDEVNARLKTTLAYRKDLAQIAEKDAAAATAPVKDKDLKPTTQGGATTSEYDALIKRINEKIAAEDAELVKGRELTEFEKFEAKVIADVDNATQKLTVAQMLNVDAVLQQAKAANDENVARAKRIKLMQAEAAFIMEGEDDIAQALLADSKAREQVSLATLAQSAALADSGELLNLEGKLIGATDKQRQIALEHLKIELKLRKDLWDLDHNKAFTDNEGGRDIERQRLIDNAEIEKSQATQRANLDEFQSIWGSIDQTAHDTFVDVLHDGSSAFKKLGDTLKSSVLDLLYQMTIKRWIFQIGASITGGGGLAGAASTGAVQGGGSALLGNIGGAAGGSSLLGAGASATMSNGLIGGFGTNMANIGTLMEGGSYMTALSAAAPYIAAAVAAGTLLVKAFSGGETRAGGQYSGTNFLRGPSGGEIGGPEVRTAIGGTMASTNAMLKGLGSTDTIGNFVTGVESSKNGKGFAYAGGTLSTGKTFGQSNSDEGIMNRRGSMSPEEAATAFSEELKQATLQALQAADVPGKLGDYLRSLGDIDKLSGGELDKALGKISKALTEKQTLEAQIYDLTTSDSQKLMDARDKERAGVDESNAALLERVYVLQDEKKATEEAAAAAQEQARIDANITSERLGLEGQLLVLRGETNEIRARERAALDDSNKALYDEIQAEKDKQDAARKAKEEADAAARKAKEDADAATRAFDDALNGALNAVDRAVAAQRSILQEQVQAIGGITSLLKDQIASLYGEVASTAAMSAGAGQAFITNALSAARATGYLPDASALSDAIGAARGGMGDEKYGSAFEANRDRLVLAGKLSQLKDLAEPQLTAAQQQLRALDEIQTQAHRDAGDQLAATLSVGEAVANLAAILAPKKAATAPAKSAGVFGGVQNSAGSGEPPIVAPSDYVYNPDAGVTFWKDGKIQNYTDGIPSYDVGTNYVPRTGLAMVHQGEEITPRGYNAGAGGVAVVQAIEALCERVDALAATQTQQLRLFQGWDGNTGLRTKAVA